jgi:hypothetical protein
MQSMFNKAATFNVSIGKWNVARVSNMQWMFQSATAVLANYCLQRSVYDNWGATLRAAYPTWLVAACTAVSSTPTAASATNPSPSGAAPTPTPSPPNTTLSPIWLAVIGCITAAVGNNNACGTNYCGAKTVTIATLTEGYACPSTVDRNNWLGADTYSDTFSVTRAVTALTVRLAWHPNRFCGARFEPSTHAVGGRGDQASWPLKRAEPSVGLGVTGGAARSIKRPMGHHPPVPMLCKYVGSRCGPLHPRISLGSPAASSHSLQLHVQPWHASQGIQHYRGVPQMPLISRSTCTAQHSTILIDGCRGACLQTWCAQARTRATHSPARALPVQMRSGCGTPPRP